MSSIRLFSRPARNALRIPLATALLILVAAARGAAQGAHAELPGYGDLIYAEAVQMPGDSDRPCRLDVFTRVAYDYIVFHRAPEAGSDSTFEGDIMLSCEVLDEQRQPVATANLRRQALVSGYLATDSRDNFLCSQQTFRLAAGRYEVSLEVSDGRSTRRRTIMLPVVLKTFSEAKLFLGSILPLADSVRRSDRAYRVYDYGASVPYARPSLLALSFAGGGASPKWSFRIARNDPARMGRPVCSGSIAPLEVLDSVSLAPLRSDSSEFAFRPARVTGRVAIFRLPFDTLEAGQYRLVVFAGDGDALDSAVGDCRVFWKDMPLSLRDPDFAIASMRYILTDDEISALNRGDDAEQLDKLSAWWREKDPTPGTVRNEVMEEYFRRADQAYFAYRTLSNHNGVQTDRGKVHILFGAPESVQRVLRPGEPGEEVWSYPSLKKTFRFVDRERNGNFRLQH